MSIKSKKETAELEGHAPSKHPKTPKEPNTQTRASDNECGPEKQRRPPQGITHNNHLKNTHLLTKRQNHTLKKLPPANHSDSRSTTTHPNHIKRTPTYTRANQITTTSTEVTTTQKHPPPPNIIPTTITSTEPPPPHITTTTTIGLPRQITSPRNRRQHKTQI